MRALNDEGGPPTYFSTADVGVRSPGSYHSARRGTTYAADDDGVNLARGVFRMDRYHTEYACRGVQRR